MTELPVRVAPAQDLWDDFTGAEEISLMEANGSEKGGSPDEHEIPV